jgi:N-acetylglutamate synthase-like GNAT family acetyltransferase
MSQATIRTAETKDAGEIARLSEQLGYPAVIEKVRRRISKIADSKQDEVFVTADEDGRVVGWIHVFDALRLESEPFAEIGGIIVDADCRNQGIGKSLLIRAEDWAKEKGLSRLRVRSRDSRDEAHRFFCGFGFTKSKTQQIFDITV